MSESLAQQANRDFLSVLQENWQAQIAGYYNVDKTNAEREARQAVINEYKDLIAIYKSNGYSELYNQVKALSAIKSGLEKSLSEAQEKLAGGEYVKSELEKKIELIKKWEWVIDGRKFDGDYKEVLKQIFSIINDTP